MKSKLDIKTYNNIFSIIHSCGIDDNVFNTAKKMDLDIVGLIYNNMLQNNSKESQEVAITTLLGVYGNFFASYYYSKLGYKVESEMPLLDSNGKEISRVDVAYKDKEGNISFCEVKTAFQIIDNMRNYIDSEQGPVTRTNYIDKDEEIIKYKNIGKKLLKQVSRLKEKSNSVNVVIFDGCHMDDIIKDKLKHLGVRIVILGANIYDLYDYIKAALLKIKLEYENQMKKEGLNI